MGAPSGATIWLTGLSGAGKSTIAEALATRLAVQGRKACVLDGDVLRQGVNAGLGFDAAGRAEAVRRAGNLAVEKARGGEVAIVCMISPYRDGRAAVRAAHDERGVPFLEVFVDCPLAVAESRDPKGLYRKARAGEIPSFTGIDDPYEAPGAEALRIPTHEMTLEQSVATILAALAAHS